jgi:amino acid permease
MGWGFFAPVGKLLQALGQSNLLPRFLCLNGAESHRTGVVVGCVIGLILCIAGHFNESFGAALQNIAISCGCIQYFANCYAYILLKTTFKQVEREFKSPFGIVGAVLCMCIFMLVLISTLFFQSDGYTGTKEYTTLTVMCALIVFLAVWYYTFVTGAQRFSPSEQKTVFRLHVYQFNMKKNKPKESENGIFQNCAPIMAMYALYATVWNKFDKETKRMSKSIDEKFDAWYAQSWQTFIDIFYPSAMDGVPRAKPKQKEGRSINIMSSFSSSKFRSLRYGTSSKPSVGVTVDNTVNNHACTT